MRPRGSTVEQELARIAATAHGVVTHDQLLAAGITRSELKQRLRSGGLLRQHRGVYRVGHEAPSLAATYLAAVWACGEGAVLSGRAAGRLHRLIKGEAPPPEVTARTARLVAGVITHRSPGLAGRDSTRVRGIPVTTVPRTLVDLAASLSLDPLARACHEAGVLHGTTPAHVDAVLARRPTARGAGNLREILRGDVHVT